MNKQFKLTLQGRKLGFQLNEGLDKGTISKLSDVGTILALMAADQTSRSFDSIETEVFGAYMYRNRLGQEKLVSALNKAIARGYLLEDLSRCASETINLPNYSKDTA